MKRELAGYCEICEREVYEGDNAVHTNRLKVAEYICMACWCKTDKFELLDLYNGEIKEVL